MQFPLAFVPTKSWHERPRNFGAPRPGGRKHAGCDLYAPVGAKIYAVANGTILSFRPFYLGSWALVVDHGSFTVRYGETKPVLPAGLEVGDRVTKGQWIGRVGKLRGLNISMIHFELYDGSRSGPLTDTSKPPFMRRRDLVDPTARLDAAARGPLPGD
jgi:murein DD-endopeptidase MepM/ murein hydrolase activator NlpD